MGKGFGASFFSQKIEIFHSDVFLAPIVKRDESFVSVKAKDKDSLIAIQGERVGHGGSMV